MPILNKSKTLTAMVGCEVGTESRYSSASCRGAAAVILYQRDNCHLCDLALGVLAEARLPEFDSVFIDDDAGLETLYGERVPVLRDERGGRELDWPFDAERVRAWLGG